MNILPFPLRLGASVFITILSGAYEDAWQFLHASGATFHFDGHEAQTSETLALHY
jgi:hypothetical protein